jgi:hypothetical protein
VRDDGTNLDDARGTSVTAGRTGRDPCSVASFGRVEQTWSIQDMIAEGDRVAVRAWNSCLQESFLGIPSRGRRQEFSATFIFRIEGGQVHEIWRNADDLGRVLQLGVRIEPAGATS